MIILGIGPLLGSSEVINYWAATLTEISETLTSISIRAISSPPPNQLMLMLNNITDFTQLITKQ